MDKIFQLLIFSGIALYFGAMLLKLLPVFVRLIGALISGTVKWPGPAVHDLDEKTTWKLQRAGLSTSRGLCPAFMESFLGVVGAFVFSVFSFLDGTSLLERYVRVDWSCGMWILSIIACIGGLISVGKANYHMAQISTLLTALSPGIEPRQVGGKTIESGYAVEHPLRNVRTRNSNFNQALALFCEATTYFQDGAGQKASVLLENALSVDPSLHEHALEFLKVLERDCAPGEAGSIYFWLAGHSEYLQKLGEAAEWYAKAADAFHQQGYQKRESRAHCNLGHVKMTMHDSEAGMAEFEKAVAINPQNGTAYINIGSIYYMLGEAGERYELALDAYAHAIVADPTRYGPVVIAQLRSIGYTWREDLEKITKRVERIRQEAGT